jgi:transposase
MTDPVLAPPRSRAAVRQTWVERLARFDSAGLSTAQFCAAEGVSLASFYLWKRRLSEQPPSHPAAAEAPRLLPVRLAAATPLELVLAGGAVLRVGPGADPEALASLLRLLGVLPC